MGLKKLSAGDGYTYLTRQVAAYDGTERGPRSLAEYYSEKGESPGRWLGGGLAGLGVDAGELVGEEQMRSLFGEGHHPNTGEPLGRSFRVFAPRAGYRDAVAAAYRAFNAERGLRGGAPVPEAERARIRTEVARRMFAERHGRAPRDARELSGFIAQESRPPTAAVSGFDLTFTPVKSVSVLWALAAPDIAGEVEAAHRAAVEDTIGWLEREVAFTRSGIGGVRQVPVRGLVAAAFVHRDSRAGDPGLHTHVAVSNKVQTLPEEGARWLALDGRVLYRGKVAASERYNTRVEAELIARLGVRFVDRASDSGRRPVREIDGISPTLSGWWSSRRAAINRCEAQLARRFQADHGRPPTPVEAIALSQQATLETRDPKHEPRSEAEQRATWRAEAVECLGGPESVGRILTNALGHAAHAPVITPERLAGTAARVLEVVAESRATWQVWHVRAEAERQARTLGVPLADLDAVVGRVVGHALTVCSVPLSAPDPVTEPAKLRRRDGSSMYDVAGSQAYSSTRVLDAEHAILTAAHRADGRRVSDTRVGIALAEAVANGVSLSDEQAALVRELAGSGRRVQLVLAPAGTGKTTAMRVLAAAWRDADGHIVGLAPSAAAAHELSHATGRLTTDTLAKLIHAHWHEPAECWPSWMKAIGPRSLVIVDEAGQAGTIDLAEVIDFVVSRGGSVRLVGDDQQLAAVAAGGVLRDLDHTFGAVRLTQVRRFTGSAEAAATVALREGDPAALGFYADNRRIHVGDPTTAADQAYAAWAQDRAAELDSVLLAATHDQVRELNERVRADRLSGSESGREVVLDDGTRASIGDVVITRRNDRRLPVSATDWVKNGDRWRVLAVHDDGSLQVRHQRHGLRVRLPAAYAAEHVQLGYATTIHASQGITTDTSHVLLTGHESRQQLYVALSRGRAANHVYLTAGTDGDPHSVIDPENLAPSTAIEILNDVLARDDAHRSATTHRREAADPAALLHDAVLRYQDALAYAAEHTLGTPWRAALDDFAEHLIPGLTAAPAYPTLAGRLALRELDGSEAQRLLASTYRWRELDSAHDQAAVLDHRLAPPTTAGPLPWLPGIPARLTGTSWGDYLDQRARLVGNLVDAVRSDTDVAIRPWAVALDQPEHARLRNDLAVWRAAYAVPDTEPWPTGPQVTGAGAEHQRDLDRRVRAVVRSEVHQDWTGVLPGGVLRDPRRAALLDRLDDLARTGADVPTLIAQALHGRPLPTEVPADALWWRITVRRPAAEPAAQLAKRAVIPRIALPTTSETKHEPHSMTHGRERDRGFAPRR